LELNYSEGKLRIDHLEKLTSENNAKVVQLESVLLCERQSKDEALQRKHQLQSEIGPLNETLKQKVSDSCVTYVCICNTMFICI
jgi:hypothetical protein